MNNIIIINETPEKYHDIAQIVISDLISLFCKYTKITGYYMKQRNELQAQNQGRVRTAENWNDFDDYYALMEELAQNCKDSKMKLLSNHITDKIYITQYDLYPSRFDFFNTGCKLNFIMKSDKKITIDAITETDGYIRYRFILRPRNDKWLIDWIGYSYKEEGYLRKMDL